MCSLKYRGEWEVKGHRKRERLKVKGDMERRETYVERSVKKQWKKRREWRVERRKQIKGMNVNCV